MTKKQKSAKRAFIRSFLSFVLCFTMFAGTTYAWYNDSVTSGRNTIVSGSLDILIQRYIGTDGNFATESNWEEVTGTTPVFDETDGALTFEPGAAQVAYVRVKNNGDLAFKYGLSLKVYEETAGINQAGETFKLSDFLKFGQKAVGAPYEKSDAGRTAAIGQVSATATKLNADAELAANATLQKGATSDIIALVIYMPEDTENEANPQPDHKPSISIGLNALAAQYTVESDSFSDQYDAAATMPDGKTDTVNGTVDTNGAITLYANATPDVASGKQTSAEFPAGSLTAGDAITLTVETNDVPPASTFSVSDDTATVAAIDLTVKKNGVEITEFNGQAVTVTTYIAKGLDPATVNVVYTGTGAQPTNVSYDGTTGKLTFKTTHFSEYVVTATGVVAYNLTTNAFYATMEDAVAQNSNIILLKNCAVAQGLTVNAGINVALDLNGYTISGNTDSTKSYAVITNKGTLTIKDSSDTAKDGTGDGLITSYISNPDGQDVPGYASNTITNNGVLTVESGKIVNNGTGYACFAIDNYSGASVTINGGRMQQMNQYTYAVRMFCNSITSNNAVTVNGGIIEGGYSFWLQTPNGNANKASLIINGGSFIARDGYAVYFGGSGSTESTRNYSNTTIEINGGSLNRVMLGGVSATEKAPVKFEINGGSITELKLGRNVLPVVKASADMPDTYSVSYGYCYIDGDKVYIEDASGNKADMYDAPWDEKAYWEANGYSFTYDSQYGDYSILFIGNTADLIG